METWAAIHGARAVRDFSAESLAREHVARIINAGRRSGSSKNSQRWEFIVVTERSRLQRLTEVGRFATHVAQAAMAIALVTPDPHADGAPLSIMFDLGRAAQNMTLAAWDLGIGSVPATVYDQELARRLLELPGTHHCEYLLSFGYPADPSVLTAPLRSGGRRTLADVIHHERW